MAQLLVRVQERVRRAPAPVAAGLSLLGPESACSVPRQGFPVCESVKAWALYMWPQPWQTSWSGTLLPCKPGAGFCASIWHLPVIDSVQEATRRVPSGAAASNDDGEPCGIRTHDTLIKRSFAQNGVLCAWEFLPKTAQLSSENATWYRRRLALVLTVIIMLISWSLHRQPIRALHVCTRLDYERSLPSSMFFCFAHSI